MTQELSPLADAMADELVYFLYELGVPREQFGAALMEVGMYYLNYEDEKAFECLDCSVNTSEIEEYYALVDEVWLEAQPDKDGMLCVGCVERRLGRTLRESDFNETAPINRLGWPHSDRLRDRLGVLALTAHQNATESHATTEQASAGGSEITEPLNGSVGSDA